jgi:transposase
MKHYREQGLSNREIAQLFKVCLSTVVRAMTQPERGFAPLSGERLLSPSQRRVTKNAKIGREQF